MHNWKITQYAQNQTLKHNLHKIKL